MTLLAAVLAIAGAAAPRAAASGAQQTILMDDDQLIYSSPSHVVDVLRQLHGLGVDQVKVSMVWLLVAPDADSSRRPHFDATDPAAYPSGAWDRYDLIDEEARALGMSVYFQIDPPAPAWAIPAGQPRQGPRLGLAPSRSLLRQFVQAVGRRYSGSYTLPAAQARQEQSSSGLPGGIPGLGPVPPVSSQTQTQSQSQPPPQSSPPLPRVSTWGVWNEPNERSWLSPTTRYLSHHRRVYLQPALYRSLVDAAWSGLAASGHSADAVLVGETANRGVLTPQQFVRDLYCVSDRGQPLAGSAAASVDCPTRPDARSFAAQHPALFAAAGYAHHPYTFDYAPDRRYPDPTFVTLGNLSAFEGLLEGAMGAYGHRRRGGMPLYLTEWGYKTDPPNPYVHTSLSDQAAWLDEGAYMTWRLPYVRALAQFLLVDDRPKATAAAGSPTYWSTFQTGLETTAGDAKPALDAFRLPLWVPNPRHGSSVTVWAQLRPADHSATQYGELEFRTSRKRSWGALREVQTSSREGFVVAHVALPSAGQLRLGWLAPSGAVEYSRIVSIR